MNMINEFLREVKRFDDTNTHSDDRIIWMPRNHIFMLIGELREDFGLDNKSTMQMMIDLESSNCVKIMGVRVMLSNLPNMGGELAYGRY